MSFVKYSKTLEHHTIIHTIKLMWVFEGLLAWDALVLQTLYVGVHSSARSPLHLQVRARLSSSAQLLRQTYNRNSSRCTANARDVISVAPATRTEGVVVARDVHLVTLSTVEVEAVAVARGRDVGGTPLQRVLRV